MKLLKIEDVLKSNLCTGCGMCTNFSSDSKIEYDNKGSLKIYNYKHLDDEIDEKTLVNEVCPGVKTYTYANDKDYIWGDFKKLYLVDLLDSKINSKNSSNIMIMKTLIYLLENKIVDYVIYVEKDKESIFYNKIKITNSIEEIMNNELYKYYQSSPLNNLLKNIDSNLRYAFIGKPCDIVALRNYEKINPSIAKNIIYKISFFCTGVPNVRCSICPDGVGMEADLVFADTLEKESNTFKDKSIVITRNSNGENLLNGLQKHSIINLEDFKIDNLKNIQFNQYERRITLKYKILAFKLCNKNLPKYEIAIKKSTKKQPEIKKVQTFKTTFRKILKNTV